MYYLKRDNAKDFSIDKCTGYDSSAPLAAHKAPVGAFYFSSFGRAYARRHFTKWHLVGDSVGLQG